MLDLDRPTTAPAPLPSPFVRAKRSALPAAITVVFAVVSAAIVLGVL